MKIDKSQKMDINFDEFDTKIFSNTRTILSELVDEMGNYQCDTIECGWSDYPSYVSFDDIKYVLQILTRLEMAYAIYNKENVK